MNEPLSIPMELDLDAVLRSTDLSGGDIGASHCKGKYRLAALMLHKGSTALSGHYGRWLSLFLSVWWCGSKNWPDSWAGNCIVVCLKSIVLLIVYFGGYAVAHVDCKMLSLRPSMEVGSAAAVESDDVSVLELNDSKGDWWRFDDTKVTQMPNGSASAPDHGSALSLKAAAQKLEQVRR